MKIKLKEAKEKDVEFLAKVCRDAKDAYSEIMPEAFEKQAKEFEKEGLPEDYKIYIIKGDDKKIGFVGVTDLTEKTAYLVGLYLLNDYQRKGYGKQTVDKLIKLLKEKDYNKICLLVHNEAEWAIDFYKKEKFVSVTGCEDIIKEYSGGRMEDYYLPSTIFMEKNF
ncbi:MAG TPA: GNAT family N-acetyltransferase [Halanaerobiales bacterium]|nr:GNAT family N-acetyltransferase [Halanaerobiales bacterium]